MTRQVSPSAMRPYGVSRTCRVLEIPRSTFHACKARLLDPKPPRKRGPKGPWGDEALLGEIRRVLESSPWNGEGHRKVWARLRFEGVRTSKGRVLRLMREAGLLAPVRVGKPRGPQAHEGTIIPDRANVMWGTDSTTTLTRLEGTATVFIAVDHASAKGVGIHAAKKGTRYEALEPLRQGIREEFGAYEEGVAAGLSLRHDHGSPFVSEVYQDELHFLGAESSPSFVRAPEGNGCAERFIRTLKEQLLWIRSFDTVEELRLALHHFLDRYNREWIVERHGYITPAEAHRRLRRCAEDAA